MVKDALVLPSYYYGLLNSEWEKGDKVYGYHRGVDPPIVHFTAAGKPWSFQASSFSNRGEWDAPFDDANRRWHDLRSDLKRLTNAPVPNTSVPNFLRSVVHILPNQHTFVKTGDIPDMWIRDSTAQVWPYRDSHPDLITAVLRQQSFFIQHDVYANSYKYHYRDTNSIGLSEQRLGRGGWVATRNYELDSGCYFLRLLHHAWKHHHLDVTEFKPTVELLVRTWIVEQRHEEHSPYRYPELPRNGLGTPVGYTGMTWSGFRPSDDACTYGYHIPSNLFAAAMLRHVVSMFPNIDGSNQLRQEILDGVKHHGTWVDDNGVERYCYEVDGLGGCNKMDDANLPSLLSIPYFDPDYVITLWKNTYEWVWSDENPYFYRGKAAEGIGSPHTPKNHIWPLSQIARGLVDPSVRDKMKDMVERTNVGGKAHESFHKDDFTKYTRDDFSWPNALFTELIL